MRILRICLHEAHTNREIADALGMNPGSCLHHVRTLVDTGLLRAESARRGARGAREVPYRATGLSWDADAPGISATLIATFLEEIRGLDPDVIAVSRLGLKLNEASRRELYDRFRDLLVEFKERPADPDGSPLSLLVAIHPDRQAG
ncbi:winged helix-turn-helix domain-containing protein [Microbacterium sp. STN6]|uniref:winged helix-turn-helix domain-containing protein n=1 Tax=Microbacterium sp. STN6 TaxID=2995588 RepID=UPI002260B1A4|nr:winged helix-turn-helix domain-containing protein [Microbacterium sp. STN6]MCX7521077.1 winged helix-turn-helix domain-containing protein [Microbacterium sp. STN6]